MAWSKEGGYPVQGKRGRSLRKSIEDEEKRIASVTLGTSDNVDGQ